MTHKDDMPTVATITGWALAGLGFVTGLLVIGYSILVMVFGA